MTLSTLYIVHVLVQEVCNDYFNIHKLNTILYF